MVLQFAIDDLSGDPTRALVLRHLAGMHEHSPPDAVHALDVDRLRSPDVTFFSAWDGPTIAAIGALRELDATAGELKSMRVADAYLGRGIGRAVLDHLIGVARARGYQRLFLETGRAPAFVPAQQLYTSAGFVACSPFGSYTPTDFSLFYTLVL